ncbi:uncharacterized protein LOC132741240 isoform X2 [Ruditapes philippinarum]|uniref:uncharacterized protein LOC132741240 isoform X2 n=1 Tax=Ruditapes philippinarum TaxID=129788 RepID=UPI00295B96A3|nr:uncharacterized protein LOC132741240 isoform X2 [Ruditapes philippinarum]
MAFNIWFGIVFCTCSSRRINKFVKGTSGQTVGHVISLNIPPELCNLKIKEITATAKFDETNSGNSIKCPEDMPVDILKENGMKYIICEFENESEKPSTTGSQNASAFDVLMAMRRKYSYLPETREKKNEKDRLYNDIIACFERENVKFMNHQIDLGTQIVKDLCNVLWYIDPFHERLKARYIKIPEPFDTFTGYRNWKQQHRQEPKITLEELNLQIERLSHILMLPWFLNEKFSSFRTKVNELATCLEKYATFLCDQNKRTEKNHHNLEPVRSWSDNFSFNIKSAHEKGLNKGKENTKKTIVKYSYSNVIEALENLDYYEPLDLVELEPIDAVKRRAWLEHMELPFPFGIFTYSHGNYLGNLTVIWKQPPDVQSRDSSEDVRVINDIKANMTKYATRTMRRDFIDMYGKSVKAKPAILRSVFSFLTGYKMSPENEQEASVDERVCEFLLNSDDPELILDLRKHNGRIKNPKFDPFWDELEKYLQEKSVVHERRHTDASYMPFAISITDLRDQILERLPSGSAAPSPSWIRLNFLPSNPYVKSALNYTGRYNVKYAVQQRLLRAQHVDSPYAYYQYDLLKHFAVKWRSVTLMQCLDDKAIIPVGEPGKPTAACSRSHNRGLVAGTNPQLLSLDHDYNICGLVPSVYLDVIIPSQVTETFHRGDVHITVKDKIFEASSPLRHGTESLKIVRETRSQDGVHSDCPIIIRYTDGGPDHRTTYASVQFAAILEFIALDLDMFIACRTAPNQSYNNPAERVMSLLNLGLQNVSLCRAEMDPGNEMLMKSMTSLKKIRNCGKPSLKSALKESVNVTMNVVKDIFSRLNRKHGYVFVHDACDETEIADLLTMIKLVTDEDIDPKWKFNKNGKFQNFMLRHCRERNYVFQIKKCDLQNVDSCPYCSLSPPRIPEDRYCSLNFLPDPVLDQDGNYKSFEEVYGTETSENDRPSLKVKFVALFIVLNVAKEGWCIVQPG